MNTEKITFAINDYQEAKAEAISVVKNNITDILKDFLEENEADVITWSQYTPYWNDGDSCEFGVNEIYFSPTQALVDKYPDYFFDAEDEIEIETDQDYEQRDIYWVSSSFTEKYGHNDTMSNLLELDNLITGTAADFMEDVFGNHVRIVVTKRGINIEEYEHD